MTTRDQSPHELRDPVKGGSVDPLQTARRWLAEGLDVAVARVVATWGSSPRRPGSVMCVNERGEFCGSVSGGCVETAVVDEALGVLGDGVPRLLDYGITNEDAWEVGLACGGSVQVWVEGPVGAKLVDALTAPADRSSPRVIATDLASGEWAVHQAVPLTDGTVTVTLETIESTEDPGRSVTLEAAAVLRADRARALEIDGRRIFLHPVNPPVRVLVVGAVHIAQALVPMIRAVGFDVVVVDPRTAFATSDRFGDVETVRAWPGDAFGALGLDRRSAVVALTHDPKLDDPALSLAVASDVFYVGALGSSRTHARRLERLDQAGIPADRLDRIHAPIGLDIGARTPGEIAAAVVAEIVRTLRASG